MRVGVDATCWSNERGYGRYARGLLTALLAEPGPHEYVFFVDARTRQNSEMPDGAHYVVVPTSESPTVAASASGRRTAHDLWRMARAVARTPIDVLFYPSVFTYFPVLTRARVVLGVHDVIAEDHLELVFPEWRRRVAWVVKGQLARRQADFIVTVSDYAKAGIIRRFHWPGERVWIVGEAPDRVFQPIGDPLLLERTLARYGLSSPARFIMYLGGLNPHKNLPALVNALSALQRDVRFADLQLVLVGPAETDTFTPGVQAVRHAVEQLGLEDRVKYTGYLPDEEVACLLTAALALVLPSLDEGYGLPAVEAAACGTPVVATRNSPLPALLEGAGLFVDPYQEDELCLALSQMLGSDLDRARMGRVARERAGALTWQKAARQFLALLSTIEGGPVSTTRFRAS